MGESMSGELGPLTGHDHSPGLCLLATDLDFSRQYKFHALQLPGEKKPRYFSRFEDALTVCLNHEQYSIVVCAAGRHWRLDVLAKGI